MSIYPVPPPDPQESDAASRGVAKALLDVLGHIPASKQASSSEPEQTAHAIAHEASRNAAITAGSLALPPGPLGWLTLLPELVSIWRIQAQMVSDIAASYGKQAELGREQMLWCLFRHSAAQAFRGLAVRNGPKLLFRHLSTTALQHLSRKIGLKITQRGLGSGLSRWLPLVGAAGVAAFAYRDTRKVAHNAIALFGGHLDLDEDNAFADDSSTASYEVKATVRQAGRSLRTRLQDRLGHTWRKPGGNSAPGERSDAADDGHER